MSRVGKKMIVVCRVYFFCAVVAVLIIIIMAGEIGQRAQLDATANWQIGKCGD